MTYKETITYLFNSAPLFQNVGGDAYKKGLSNTHLLDGHFNHPHKLYKTIHIAGTNGKGSCAHTIAAMLQHKGLRVGLYTSPHLIDFRERIRVNGEMISEQYVVDFVENHRSFFEPLHPSFFELTTALAFKYFADTKVDVAVIEVGLGGRLDCTNIINPVLSLITNISLDHTQFLGHTLAAIAGEKAGIIKPHTPIIIGETTSETRPVFQEKAEKADAPITYAEDEQEIVGSHVNEHNLRVYQTKSFGSFEGELIGDCQIKNTNTVLCAYKQLKGIFHLSDEDLFFAFRRVCDATGLQGRWQILQHEPTIVCDTGHNTGGWSILGKQLQKACQQYNNVYVVFGMASDKDVDHVMSQLPKQAHYLWTKASVHRAMPEIKVAELATEHGLHGKAISDVPHAYKESLRLATKDDFIYIGGSSFVVADLLTFLQQDQAN